MKIDFIKIRIRKIFFKNLPMNLAVVFLQSKNVPQHNPSTSVSALTVIYFEINLSFPDRVYIMYVVEA
jgi:hypothetical protein